jgi:dipeptidyl-peptidase-3
MRFCRTLAWTVLSGVMVLTSSSAAPPAGVAVAAQSPEVERIGGRSFIQVEAPSFSSLPLRQKLVAYHLAMAAVQMDPIFYDQMSATGLSVKRLLGAMVERPERLPADSRAQVVEYAKLFFGNHGNHNETTNEKFVPTITFEQFSHSAESARQAGASLGTAAELGKKLNDLKPTLFDPKFQVSITERNPPAGEDILAASSNNYYSGVTTADLKNFTERNPLNSRLVKRNGSLVEEVYRAGTPDGKVPAGLYATELKAVDTELELAAQQANPDQAAEIRALIHYYQTGDPKDWTAFNVLWVRNDSPVDFASGFIEIYRDARGAKGSSQMVVSVNNRELGPLMQKLAASAVYFEGKAPWETRFKKLDVKPPVGKAIETVVESGDFGVTTIGDNLPNEQSFREKYGTKSILLVSSAEAFGRIRGAKVAVEFSQEPDEAALFEQAGNMASTLLTAMHEIIGHGSGKVVIKQEPSAALREYYSTLEEARADLVAYWNISDPKLIELGVKDSKAVAHELYRALGRVGLTTLNHYPTGDRAEEDHDRNRLLEVNYLIEAGAMKQFQKDGHWYIAVVSDEAVHAGVGKLLAEIMRIKATGDYEGIKALVNKYGIHFNPAVRDDVVARYKKLQLPRYFTGIYADLALVNGTGGKPSDVAISYPRNFLGQQLAFARINHTLGF